jgi:hypothetical protein
MPKINRDYQPTSEQVDLVAMATDALIAKMNELAKDAGCNGEVAVAALYAAAHFNKHTVTKGGTIKSPLGVAKLVKSFGMIADVVWRN